MQAKWLQLRRVQTEAVDNALPWDAHFGVQHLPRHESRFDSGMTNPYFDQDQCWLMADCTASNMKVLSFQARQPICQIIQRRLSLHIPQEEVKQVPWLLQHWTPDSCQLQHAWRSLLCPHYARLNAFMQCGCSKNDQGPLVDGVSKAGLTQSCWRHGERALFLVGNPPIRRT